MTVPAPAAGGGALAWLRTREGKIVAGGAAVVAVVLLALRKGSGGAAGGGGFVAEPQQGLADGTIQDRLDQLTGTGGTVDELRATTRGIAGSVERLTDLMESQDKVTAPGQIRATAGKKALTWTWDPVPGAIGYEVARELAGKIVSRSTVHGLTHSWAGLASNHPYGLQVRAVMPGGKTGPVARLVSRPS